MLFQIGTSNQFSILTNAGCIITVSLGRFNTNHIVGVTVKCLRIRLILRPSKYRTMQKVPTDSL